jgi:RimJ/RimL family protein N-acetyltransferase
MKLFANAGFELAGTKKEWIREDGEWKDENLMQLIKKISNM